MPKVYVDRKVIERNDENGTDDPPFLVEWRPGEELRPFREVYCRSFSKIVYDRHAPVGRRVWIEADWIDWPFAFDEEM